MPFYYLHDKKLTPADANHFKYLYFTEIDFDKQSYSTLTLDNEPNIKFCPHKASGNIHHWSPDDTQIDVIGHENKIISSYVKIPIPELELWSNINYINSPLNNGICL